MPTVASIKSQRRATQVLLDPDVRQALRNNWAANGRNQSDTVNLAVRAFLNVSGKHNSKPSS